VSSLLNLPPGKHNTSDMLFGPRRWSFWTGRARRDTPAVDSPGRPELYGPWAGRLVINSSLKPTVREDASSESSDDTAQNRCHVNTVTFTWTVFYSVLQSQPLQDECVYIVRVHTHVDRRVSRTLNQISMTKYFVKSRCLHEKVRKYWILTINENSKSYSKYRVNDHMNTTRFHDFSKTLGISFFFTDFSRPGNNF